MSKTRNSTIDGAWTNLHEGLSSLALARETTPAQRQQTRKEGGDIRARRIGGAEPRASCRR